MPELLSENVLGRLDGAEELYYRLILVAAPSGAGKTEEGLSPVEVVYAKNLRDHSDLGRVEERVSRPSVRTAGLVVDAVDRIMPGMTLGSVGMHNQVKLWTGRGVLAGLLETGNRGIFSAPAQVAVPDGSGRREYPIRALVGAASFYPPPSGNSRTRRPEQPAAGDLPSGTR